MTKPTNDLISQILSQATPAARLAKPFAPDISTHTQSEMRLHFNENPLNLPVKVLLDTDQLFNEFHYYSDIYSLKLRQTAAELHGLSKEQVMAGNGSSEILSLLHRTFLNKGDHAVMLSPGFSLNRKFAAIQEAVLDEVPFTEGPSLPIDTLVERAKAGAKMIIIANPNNPTGSFVKLSAIKNLLDAVSIPVILDEAYVDFASESGLSLIDRYPHLIVLHSFSKSYAMAGLRVGLGYGHPELMQMMRNLQNEFSVNIVGQSIAIAILKNKDLFLPAIKEIVAQRTRLFDFLKSQHFTPTPSSANFVFTQTPAGSTGADWQKALAKQNILVSAFSEKGLENALRITVGTAAQMDKFEEAVKSAALAR